MWDKEARQFHRRAQSIANRLSCDLIGSDHKADTITMRHYSKPNFQFTVPAEWAGGLQMYEHRYHYD